MHLCNPDSAIFIFFLSPLPVSAGVRRSLWGIKAASGQRTVKSGDATSCRCTGGCCNFRDVRVRATKAILLFICISTHKEKFLPPPLGPVVDSPLFLHLFDFRSVCVFFFFFALYMLTSENIPQMAQVMQSNFFSIYFLFLEEHFYKNTKVCTADTISLINSINEMKILGNAEEFGGITDKQNNQREQLHRMESPEPQSVATKPYGITQNPTYCVSAR